MNPWMQNRKWFAGWRIALLGAFFMCAIAGTADAATLAKTVPPPFEIAGWVPYWRVATGTADAIAHMDVFKEISPFGYSVKKDGTLVDMMKLDDPAWQQLITVARAGKVRVIPTVMWSDGNAIDKVMKSAKLRKAHIAGIVKEVNDRGWDGIDIDYEGKKAGTKDYFSIFLRDLYKAIGKKFVVCTIEARTPLQDRFTVIPKDIRYANDFTAINKYCDRVRIMAYDQGSIDLKLNKKVEGPYMPVADPKWVEKVVTLAAKTISKKKILIGVATYGYESEMKPFGSGFSYDILWSFNPRYALDIAARMGITPVRNKAGELSFLYMPLLDAGASTEQKSVPSNNPDLALAGAVAAATGTASQVVPHLVWWSDASAIKDKVLLARKLGVRGVAIFKIDGGADPLMWGALK